MKNTVMVTLKSKDEPTLQEIKDAFNLKAGEIDENFGVIRLTLPSDEEQSFCILVEEEAAKRMEEKKDPRLGGVFSNPSIGPK